MIKKAMPPLRQNMRLLDQVHLAVRRRHSSYRTEQVYVHWIRRYILFHDKRHPAEMGKAEVAAFLSHLAVTRRVSAATQNQTLNAILFLYKQVLERDIGLIQGVTRAKRAERLPVVLTREEVQAVLQRLHGRERLMASLLYGWELRVMECVRLRVKDLDFGFCQIMVRDGKGKKDRAAPMPQTLIPAIQSQLRLAKKIHDNDLADGFGKVSLPYALQRKYPNAAGEWSWQYLFAASKRARDLYSGKWKRHHIDESVLPLACKRRSGALRTQRNALGQDSRTPLRGSRRAFEHAATASTRSIRPLCDA